MTLPITSYQKVNIDDWNATHIAISLSCCTQDTFSHRSVLPWDRSDEILVDFTAGENTLFERILRSGRLQLANTIRHQVPLEKLPEAQNSLRIPAASTGKVWKAVPSGICREHAP